jgi:hypothetical protein
MNVSAALAGAVTPADAPAGASVGARAGAGAGKAASAPAPALTTTAASAAAFAAEPDTGSSAERTLAVASAPTSAVAVAAGLVPRASSLDLLRALPGVTPAAVPRLTRAFGSLAALAAAPEEAIAATIGAINGGKLYRFLNGLK